MSEVPTLLQLHDELVKQRQSLRRREKSLKLRQKILSSHPNANLSPDSVEASLAAIFPPELMPRNVGTITDVAWGFWFSMDFDFGVDPTYSANSRQSREIRATQEAAFILTSMSFAFADSSTASLRPPLQITLRDLQSLRQLNDIPVPIQSFGRNSRPTQLLSGYLLMPNGRLEGEVSSWMPPGELMPTVGDGRFQIMFHGVRIRVQDFDSVMSTVFKSE